MDEVWKDVKGYEGFYKISNLGRVLSISRNGTKKSDSIRIPCNGMRYLHVNLSKNNKCKTHKIHVLVAQAFLNYETSKDIVVDHINNNPHDNRVENLQLITRRENNSKDRVGSSLFVGVTWYKPYSKWRSQIRINGKKIHLGYFDNEVDASNAYNLKLKSMS